MTWTLLIRASLLSKCNELCI